MFAGFRSRWTMPCSCAASSASAICLAIGSASSSGIGPRAIRCERSSPSTSSITSARDAAALFEPVDAGDVRMIERRERLRFALEARQPIGVLRERLRQDLDRDVAIELRVARAIDLPHAAFADRRSDLVDAETGAGSEGQVVGLYGRTDVWPTVRFQSLQILAARVARQMQVAVGLQARPGVRRGLRRRAERSAVSDVLRACRNTMLVHQIEGSVTTDGTAPP